MSLRGKHIVRNCRGKNMCNICKQRWHKTECENQNENQVFNNSQANTNTERINNVQSLTTVNSDFQRKQFK